LLYNSILECLLARDFGKGRHQADCCRCCRAVSGILQQHETTQRQRPRASRAPLSQYLASGRRSLELANIQGLGISICGLMSSIRRTCTFSSPFVKWLFAKALSPSFGSRPTTCTLSIEYIWSWNRGPLLLELVTATSMQSSDWKIPESLAFDRENPKQLAIYRYDRVRN
jgi:hypothetical protein